MRFAKMEGLGNDFVVVEGQQPDSATVQEWCDRRRGIGADGVLLIGSEPSMHYWNADGTVAEMCGNGLRCVARYAVERAWAPAGEWFEIETPVGRRRARVDGEDICVEIGHVALGDTVDLYGRSYRLATVGNPHAVTLVDDPAGVDVAGEGRRVATDPLFPRGVNVEYVADLGAERLRLRVWERGVGETMACGTGMVAAAAVAAAGAPGSRTVEVAGGVAMVTTDEETSYLTGPAVKVFEGRWLLT